MRVDNISTLAGDIGLVPSASLAVRSVNTTVSISATTTAPTKATTPAVDLINAVDDGSGWVTVTMMYRQSNATGAGNGNGSYLFALPGGHQFNTTTHPIYNVDNGSIPTFAIITTQLPGAIATVVTSTTHQRYYIVPYSATQFRLAGSTTIQGTTNGVNAWLGSANIGIADTVCTYLANFRFRKA